MLGGRDVIGTGAPSGDLGLELPTAVGGGVPCGLETAEVAAFAEWGVTKVAAFTG